MMVYLLKFGASWILPPGIFILMFWGAAWYVWRKYRDRKLALFIFGVTFAFYLLCTAWLADILMGSIEAKYSPPDELSGDVIIMLGGGAIADVPDVDGVGALCAAPANRLLTVARLQKKLNVPVLFSGGQVYADSGAEALIARRVLMSLGVKPEVILIENKSVNTRQNAAYSAKLLQEWGFKKPILVTSAFHMNRAVLNFEQVGLKVVPYPTDYTVSRRPVFHFTKLRPQTEALWDNVTVLQEKLRTLVTRFFKR